MGYRACLATGAGVGRLAAQAGPADSADPGAFSVIAQTAAAASLRRSGLVADWRRLAAAVAVPGAEAVPVRLRYHPQSAVDPAQAQRLLPNGPPATKSVAAARHYSAFPEVQDYTKSRSADRRAHRAAHRDQTCQTPAHPHPALRWSYRSS